ncbi:MAG TPA: hypothetical protein VHR66_31530 [Gemmataceae bacterium]|nr:hypothetical protein [Gemmataceae bacterium]
MRAIDHNDIRDLDAMSIAVPYCNVIVVEKYWGHQVGATRLDAKYGAKVLTDLRELPKELKLIGCVA